MKRIEEKLREIEDSLAIIEEGLPATVEDFKHSGLIKDGLMKRLEFCIQNLIGVFSLIYSTEKLGVPASLDEIFSGLLEKKIFSKKVLDLARDMKGMRNILIHKYGKVDDDLVYEHLQEHLDDFRLLIKAVDKYLS